MVSLHYTQKIIDKTADVQPTLGAHTDANITQKVTTNVVTKTYSKNDYQNQMKEGKDVKKTHKKTDETGKIIS